MVVMVAMAISLSSRCPDTLALCASERQWRVVALLGWPLVLGAASWLLAWGGVPLCPFRALTDIPCPLCGGTHFCAALAAGDFLAAWQANPGLVPLFLIAAVHSLVLACEAWLARRLPSWHVGAAVWGMGVVALVVAWLLGLTRMQHSFLLFSPF